MSNKDVASALVSQEWEDNTDDDDASNEWTPSNFLDKDEDDDEDLEESPKKPAAKVPRLGNYNRRWWCLFIDDNGKSYFPDDGYPENVDNALWVLAQREFRGSPANQVFFLNGEYQENKGHTILYLRCALYHQAKCRKPSYKVVYSKATNMHRVGRIKYPLVLSPS